MSVIKEKEQTYEPVSADIHNAICAEYVDLGMQKTKFGLKPTGLLYFQVEERNSKTGIQKTVSTRFALSTGTSTKPSIIRSLLKGWRGRDLTAEEAKEGFDVQTIVGTQGRLVIEQNPDQADPSKIYANIKGALPQKAGSPNVLLEGYVTHAEREQKKKEWEEKNKPNNEAVNRANQMAIPT